MSSTVGGNPVSSAAVIAILDIMDEEKLADNALKIGQVIKSRLLEIQEKSRIVGEVRGRGLVMGVELVKDKKTKEPAADLTKKLIVRAAEKGLLIGSVGTGNVIRVAAAGDDRGPGHEAWTRRRRRPTWRSRLPWGATVVSVSTCLV